MSRKRGPSTGQEGPSTKKIKPINHSTEGRFPPMAPPIIIANPLGAIEQSRIAQLKKIENDWRKVISQSQSSGTLQKELEQLKNLTHPHYAQHLKTLERERDTKLQLLREWKEQQLESIEKTMSAGVKGANDEYEINIETAKEALLKICEAEKKKLEGLKNGNSQRGKLRANKSKVSDDSTFVTEGIKRLTVLTSSEINDDMATIRAALRGSKSVDRMQIEEEQKL